MKRYLAYVCVLVSVFMLMGKSYPAKAQDDVTGDISLIRVESAAFRQERHVAILERPLVSSGVLRILPDGEILWQQSDPYAFELIISTEGIRENLPGENDQSIKIESNLLTLTIARALSGLFEGDFSGLSAFFDVEIEGGNAGFRARLKPMDKILMAAISSIEVEGRDVIEHIRILEPSGDWTDIYLSDHNGDQG